MRTLAPAAERQRLDKWLWFARLAKTRRQAVRLVEEGFVRIDARRADSPSKPVGRGDVLTIAFERNIRVLRVLNIAERRGPIREARALFEEVDACLPKGCKGDSNAGGVERCVPKAPRGGVE
jgi:ribosome-associated heat shock protein Hsp15